MTAQQAIADGKLVYINFINGRVNELRIEPAPAPVMLREPRKLNAVNAEQTSLPFEDMSRRRRRHRGGRKVREIRERAVNRNIQEDTHGPEWVKDKLTKKSKKVWRPVAKPAEPEVLEPELSVPPPVTDSEDEWKPFTSAQTTRKLAMLCGPDSDGIESAVSYSQRPNQLASSPRTPPTVPDMVDALKNRDSAKLREWRHDIVLYREEIRLCILAQSGKDTGYGWKAANIVFGSVLPVMANSFWSYQNMRPPTSKTDMFVQAVVRGLPYVATKWMGF